MVHYCWLFNYSYFPTVIIIIIITVFREIFSEEGKMSKRMYSTKTKELPTQKEVEEIDKVCEKMILDKCVISHSNPWSAFWILNYIVYSAVIGWIIVNGIKPLRTDITCMDNRRGMWKQPKWLIELDEEILQLRSLISQCCAERERLWYSR